MCKKLVFIFVVLLIVTAQAGVRIPPGGIVAGFSAEAYTGAAMNSCNWNGLDGTGLLHGASTWSCWNLSPANMLPNGAWISYDLGSPYLIQNMWVWNYNGNAPDWLNEKDRSVRNVDIEYSLNGVSWTLLKHVEFQLNPYGGWPFPHSDDIELGVTARYIKLKVAPLTNDATSGNWTGTTGTYTALAEVAFFEGVYIASGPDPFNGETAVGMSKTLSWDAGMGDVASHNVYLGTSPTSLALVSEEQAETSYTPVGGLEFDTTYYWRVDEVGASVVQGDVWSFRTIQVLNIDDFEAYDESGNDLWRTWSSGQDTWDNGSAVSLSYDTRHGGAQAMQFDYDNESEWLNYFSETTRPVAGVVDDIKAMDFYMRGIVGNAVETVYVELSDGTTTATVNLDVADANTASWDWQLVRVDLTTLGLTIANIESLTIGIGNKANPVASTAGTIYVDDIQMHPARCLEGNPAGDINGDCYTNFLDIATVGSTWLEDGMWP